MNSFILFDQLDEFYSRLKVMLRTIDYEKKQYKDIFILKKTDSNLSTFKYAYTILGKDDLNGLIISINVLSKNLSEKEYWNYAKKGIGKLGDREDIYSCITTLKYSNFYCRIDDIYYIGKEDIFISNDDDINSNIIFTLNLNKNKIK